MTHELPSTGETQVIPAEEHHGFVDSCIALIENLLDGRELPTFGAPARDADRPLLISLVLRLKALATVGLIYIRPMSLIDRIVEHNRVYSKKNFNLAHLTAEPQRQLAIIGCIDLA